MKSKDKEMDELLRECAENEEKYKNIQKAVGLLKGFLKTAECFPEREKQSEMDKKLLLIRELTWIRQMSLIPENQELMRKHAADMEIELDVESYEETYEQLALPGCEVEKKEAGKMKKKVSLALFEKKCYQKVSPERTMGEVLEDHSKKWLADCNKYFGTRVLASSSKKGLIKGIEEWVAANPLQLLLAFAESTVKCLRRLVELEEGANISITDKNVDDYMWLMTWGLLDASLKHHDGKIFLGISVPTYVKESLLPCLEDISKEAMEQSDVWCYFESHQEKISGEKAFWQGIMEFGDDIHLLLDQYGALDEKTFHELFTQRYQRNLTQEQLMRFVYLWGTYHQRLVTGKLREGKEVFVGNPEINFDSVIIKRYKYCKDISYKQQSAREYLEESAQVMALWAAVGASFQEWDLDEEEIQRIMIDGYLRVKEGLSVTDLVEYILDYFDIDVSFDFAMLWRFLVRIGLGTPLPMLCGHSRMGFQQEYGKYQYLDLFKGSNKKPRKAALYELPVELQEQLADLIFLAETADYELLKAEEEKLPLSCLYNEQVKIFLIANRLEAYDHIKDEGQKSAVEKELRKMILDFCEECRDDDVYSSMMELAGQFGILQIVEMEQPVHENRGNVETDYDWNEGWLEAVVPVVKADKVYPNDPCPCGSGKKFKKCCKGKGIYD